MQGGTIFLVEPVSGIERQKFDFGAFREIGRLVNDQPTGLHSTLQCHRAILASTTRRRSSVKAGSSDNSRVFGSGYRGICPPASPFGRFHWRRWTAKLLPLRVVYLRPAQDHLWDVSLELRVRVFLRACWTRHPTVWTVDVRGDGVVYPMAAQRSIENPMGLVPVASGVVPQRSKQWRDVRRLAA
jgi:hypothetical protein